jgi:hypothetical protein
MRHEDTAMVQLLFRTMRRCGLPQRYVSRSHWDGFFYRVVMSMPGGTLQGVRDLLDEKEKAIRASFKEPERPQRVKNNKMTKEERVAAEKEYAAKQKQYEVAMREVNKKREEARQKFRAESRGYQESMRDVSDTMRYTSLSLRDRKVQLPHDYQYADAKPKATVEGKVMMGHECNTLPGETPLEAYARWMTSKDNPRFTTVIANRMWKRVFGLALIEPLDELMDNTVPMNAELQKHLEKHYEMGLEIQKQKSNHY